jgi:Skp family chaperone for outer membrane proteins
MKPKFFLAAAVALLLAAPAFAQAPQGAGSQGAKTKIAIVDILAFRDGILELKVKYEKLTGEFQNKYRELDTLQNSLKAKEQVLQENKTLTPAQSQKLTDEYEQMKKEYNRMLEDSQAMAGKREREETEAIYDKLSKFMDQYCAKYGITHVFDANRLRETGVVVYAASTANITNDFIAEYNKANPAPAATAKQN